MQKLFRTTVFCVACYGSLISGTGLMGRANADTITFTSDLFVVLSPNLIFVETTQLNGSATALTSQTVTLDQFDPSLGPLNSVTFTLRSSLTDIRGHPLPAPTRLDLVILFGPFNHGVMRIEQTLRVTSVLTGDLFNDTFGLHTECSVTNGITNSSCSSSSFTSEAFEGDVGRLPLAGFQGLGTYPVDFIQDLELFLIKDVDNGTIMSGSTQAPWSGFLDVTYTYNVPEPGVLILLGSGLPCLLGFRRRRVAA